MRCSLSIIATVVAMCGSFASSPLEQMFGTNFVYATIMSDGSTNKWTIKDFGDALGMMNRMYHRKIATIEGRKEYHGKLVKEVVNTNNLTKTEVYEDGKTFTFPFKVISPSHAVSNLNKRFSVTFTNGVPRALALARERRLREISSTNVVTDILAPGMVKTIKEGE